ncbi:MAG: HdeD family acid-resistance protein [Deltaproteobacteria bacterium]|nr:HdeD family acid-resistance protein [Deltaproteobacteria bacterium]MBW2122083.1 HdeD family acid-resistance protein [Deltaproteobacteria bacterium]
MAQNNTEIMAAEQNEVFGEVRKHWGWLLGLGIVFVILGIIGLGMTFGLTMASVLFVGVLILIGGGLQLFDSFKCKGWKSILWHVIIAFLYIFAGIVIITHPLLASTLFTAMLAIGILAVGILRIIMAIELRSSKGWGWVLFSGIISVLLGLVILSHWPVSGLWVIGLLIAIEMIVHGWSYIIMALTVRSIAR